MTIAEGDPCDARRHEMLARERLARERLARERLAHERLAREELAGEKLGAELATVPAWGSAAFQAWLVQTDMASALSPGAMVHCLRRAVAAGDLAVQELLFVALLRRIEPQNARWAHRALARTPLTRPQREGVREDLKQELTLFLWQRLAREHDSAWELYFSRALDFAQRHVAHAFLVRNGYWRSTAPSVIPLSTLPTASVGGDLSGYDAAREPGMGTGLTMPDPFVAAELADLRMLALRLPYRERVAVIMRFWLAASEHEIAWVLGVTTRTVRNLLARAQIRLRGEYAGISTGVREADPAPIPASNAPGGGGTQPTYS